MISGIIALIGLYTAHAEAIAILAFALHAAASFFVSFTDTPADDRVYAKFYRAAEVVAGILTKRAKL